MPRESSVRPITAARSRPPLREKLLRLMMPAIATRETPMISVVLAVTEPIALPMASCAEPFIAARTETSSSGRVVAKETTVAPTTNFGIPVASANQEAESTNQSPPLMVSTRPTTKMTAATASRAPPVIEPKNAKPKNSIFCPS